MIFYLVVGVWMELESNGVSARCFMRQRGRRIGLRGHRGRQVCRPTAQSGRRSSARGCSARFVPAGFGSFRIRRTQNWGFGVRIGEKDGRRTRNGLFGVRGRVKVICECKPLSTVMYNRCRLRLCGVLRGVRLMCPRACKIVLSLIYREVACLGV